MLLLQLQQYVETLYCNSAAIVFIAQGRLTWLTRASISWYFLIWPQTPRL